MIEKSRGCSTRSEGDLSERPNALFGVRPGERIHLAIIEGNEPNKGCADDYENQDDRAGDNYGFFHIEGQV